MKIPVGLSAAVFFIVPEHRALGALQELNFGPAFRGQAEGRHPEEFRNVCQQPVSLRRNKSEAC